MNLLNPINGQIIELATAQELASVIGGDQPGPVMPPPVPDKPPLEKGVKGLILGISLESLSNLPPAPNWVGDSLPISPGLS